MLLELWGPIRAPTPPQEVGSGTGQLTSQRGSRCGQRCPECRPQQTPPVRCELSVLGTERWRQKPPAPVLTVDQHHLWG